MHTSKICETEYLHTEKIEHIPIGIFTPQLGTLEAITKYLKENRGLRLSRIALLLNRDTRTIWGAYHSSTTKHPGQFSDGNSQLELPLHIFTNRSFGMLESVVFYLRESVGVPLTKIAALTCRDYSTVWTACARAKTKKRRQQCAQLQ